MAARPEGFFIGDFYILRSKYSTQLIPRVHVSYVSATYSSTPLLLILGVLAIVLGLVMLANAQFQGDLQAPGLLATLGVILIVAFFSSRKIGSSSLHREASYSWKAAGRTATLS